MREYFDDSWEVIDIIENVIPSFDAGHPFNKKEHKHLVGPYICKEKNIKEENINLLIIFQYL